MGFELAWRGIIRTGKKETQMRITSKGQVTIPQAVREKAGFLPDTEVDFVVERNAVRIVKARSTRSLGRGAKVIGHLRRAPGHVSMTTDEIMALTRDNA